MSFYPLATPGLIHQAYTHPGYQGGQALTEFLVVMLVILPLFFGVYYLGKYADLHQSIVQASRYAAFQRAIQPDERQLPTSQIEDQLRARFFLRNEAFTKDGRLSSSDSIQFLRNDQDQVPFWRDLAGNPLLKDHSQIQLSFQSASLDAVTTPVTVAADWLYGQKNRPIQRANLEVSLFDPLNAGAPLKIGASTATLGDAWNAAGSESIREAMTLTKGKNSASTSLTGFTQALQAVSWVIGLFENHSPTFPCLSVETVPIHRTSGGEQIEYRACQ